MYQTVDFIPDPDRVSAATTDPAPYERAWTLAHSVSGVSAAIDAVRAALGVSYDLASGLVWAEMASPTVRLPRVLTRR